MAEEEKILDREPVPDKPTETDNHKNFWQDLKELLSHLIEALAGRKAFSVYERELQALSEKTNEAIFQGAVNQELLEKLMGVMDGINNEADKVEHYQKEVMDKIKEYGDDPVIFKQEHEDGTTDYYYMKNEKNVLMSMDNGEEKGTNALSVVDKDKIIFNSLKVTVGKDGVFERYSEKTINKNDVDSLTKKKGMILMAADTKYFADPTFTHDDYVYSVNEIAKALNSKVKDSLEDIREKTEMAVTVISKIRNGIEEGNIKTYEDIEEKYSYARNKETKEKGFGAVVGKEVAEKVKKSFETVEVKKEVEKENDNIEEER